MLPEIKSFREGKLPELGSNCSSRYWGFWANREPFAADKGAAGAGGIKWRNSDWRRDPTTKSTSAYYFNIRYFFAFIFLPLPFPALFIAFIYLALV